MPPKAKITKDMVVDAAFEIARKSGAENINARAVSKKLNCSTQPVMYHFATMDALRRAAYKKADGYHTEYLMKLPETREAVLLGIGMNYIRFAVEEPHLFRFLFQSGFIESSLPEIIDSEELRPVLSAMQETMKMNSEQTKEVFVTLAMFVHGYAGIIAGNSFQYDEKLVAAQLKRVYRGAVLAVQEEAAGTALKISKEGKLV